MADVNGDAVLESNSIQKLFTAGAALLRLGAGFRYRTQLRAAGDDLALVASGDPTFDGAALARLCSAARSGRRVRRLVVDAGRYDRLGSVPGWKDYYVPAFMGPLSALVVDRNRGRRDEAYVADPVPVNAARVLDALRAAGVVVENGACVGAAPVDGPVVAEHVSAPLGEIVADMVRASDSFGAELITKELGHGTTAGGLAVIDEAAARLGVPRSAGASAADGSGLAEATSDTARRQVAWLRAMEHNEEFRRCLPVAASSGTLTGRFVGTPAAGRVTAKTGTRRLHGTVNLAGYATTTTGRRLRFAVTVTGARSHAAAVAAVDGAVVALVGR